MGSRLTRRVASAHAERADAPSADPDQLDLSLPPTRGQGRPVSEGMAGSTPARERGEPPHDGARAFQRHTTFALLVVGALALTASRAWAAGAGSAMPWDGPLTLLVNNLTGTTARLLVTVAVVGAGLLWAFTRNEEGLKKLGQIAFGGAIALGAVAFMGNLGFAGAAF